MECTSSTPRQTTRLVGWIAALLILLTSSSAIGHAASGGRDIVGPWAVELTLRDCTTGAAMGAPIPVLITFHADGTLMDAYSSTTFAPGQRTVAHGTWTPQRSSRRGGHAFAMRLMALMTFDTAPNLPGPDFDPTRPITPGFQAGWKTVHHTVTLTGRNTIASEGTHAFYNTAGDAYRTGCSSSEGQRVK